MHSQKLGWLLLSPTILILGLFGIFPFIYVVWVSFHQWNPFAANPQMVFNWASNYRSLVFDQQFLASLGITIAFVFFAVVSELVLGYVLAGVLLCLPVITIPWAIAAFRIAAYALWPFGRTIVPKPSAGVGSFLGNVIWFVLAGWWLAIAHVLSAIALAITIIGIPLALADLKLIPISLAPLGKDIVSTRRGEFDRYA